MIQLLIELVTLGCTGIFVGGMFMVMYAVVPSWRAMTPWQWVYNQQHLGPHIDSYMPLLDVINPAAKTIGAVNTIVPSKDDSGRTILTGHNTDWQGMVLALRNAGAHGNTGIFNEAGMVIGGGGTARAAIFALKNMGCNPIYLVGRNKSKLTRMLPELSENKKVEIFEGSIDDVSLLASAVRGTKAVFLTV